MLHVCCNDPDNGLFYGRADQLMIGSIELEALRDPVPKFVELDGAIRLAGKVWPVMSSKDWVGNWCWNAYTLGNAGDPKTEKHELARFLIWLRRRRLFGCVCGPPAFFNWWESTTNSATPLDVHGWVCSAMEGA